MQLSIENEVIDRPLPPEYEALIEKTVRTTLEIEEFEDNVEISLRFVNAAGIKALNRDYREKDMVTDVLSFPQYTEDGWDAFEDEPVFLGDIVICLDQAILQAETFGHPLERELAYLVCHSVLHLLGYDHEEQADKSAMRTQEKMIMKAMGLEQVIENEV